MLEAFAPPYRSQLWMDASACDGWAEPAGVVPSHGALYSIRKAVGWARRFGEWTFPSASVAELDLQAFALSRACAAGSPVARAPGRLPSLTSQSVCRRCYGVRCFLRPRLSPRPARHASLSRFALGDSFRRPFVVQAELGKEFFSGQGCRPVGFAFEGVCWAGA